MENMKPLLNLEVMTTSGQTLEQNLNGYEYKFSENTEIIKDLKTPFGNTGGIAVLEGNLAPKTAISKPGAIDPGLHHFTGRAKVYDSEETAEAAILKGDIKDGDVVVIRYEGPKGGPGMREMFKAMKYLYGMGLSKTTALVTDGRFSGTNNGCFVGHVSPEAAEGGPIAIVKDGDEITIDVNEGILSINLSEEQIEERLSQWKKPKRKFTKGYLELYSRVASSAAEGAIIKREEE
jgi:dihydroxy-acid dehydratase